MENKSIQRQSKFFEYSTSGFVLPYSVFYSYMLRIFECTAMMFCCISFFFSLLLLLTAGEPSCRESKFTVTLLLPPLVCVPRLNFSGGVAMWRFYKQTNNLRDKSGERKKQRGTQERKKEIR